MKSHQFKIISIFFLASILILGCSKQEKKATISKFDYGHIENHKYINPFFNMQISLNKDWFIQEQSHLKEIQKLGEEFITDGNKNLQSLVKRSQINNVILLGQFKYEIGSPVDFNPSILIGGENLQKAPGIRKASDYLFHTKKLLSQSQVKFNIDENYGTTMIDDQLFSIMNLSMDSPLGGVVKQQYYVTLKNKFALYFVLSYSNENEKNELLKMLNTLTF